MKRAEAPVWASAFVLSAMRGELALAFAAVEDLEVVAGVGGEEGCDGAEAFGEGRGGEEGVLALAEVVVVKVHGEGEHVDGEGIGEGGLFVDFAGALVGGHGFALGVEDGVEGAAAGFPCVLAGFSLDAGLGLGPDHVGEGGGDADGIDEVVGDVDEELKGEAEAVFDEAGGEEDAFDGAHGDVAMADGAVAELDGEGLGDFSGFAFGHDEGDEVVAALLERGSEAGRDGGDEALHFGVAEAGFAPGGVVESVGGGGHGYGGGNLFGGAERVLYRDRHDSLY